MRAAPDGRCKALTVAGRRCRLGATFGPVCRRHRRHIIEEKCRECHPPELVRAVWREERRRLGRDRIREVHRKAAEEDLRLIGGAR